MGRLVARGKYLFDGERKFFARGVSYGPFPPNSRDERYPEPERVASDFALMNQMGANVVRCYVPPPPWLLEEAIRHQLRLMVGIPWPFHMAFLDNREMTDDIRKSIRSGVNELKHYGDAIFAYSLGNEIRSDIARWYGPRATSKFLGELCDIGKQADPEGLFTYSNYPTTEYLDLNFLDFVCFNVYLHREEDFRRYMTHLMAATGERPLVLSETGMDTIREGEEHQAQLLSWQARAAFEIGLSGFIVFAFTDEWHTGGAEITDWAFGLVSKGRNPKRGFEAVSEIFRGELPPALRVTPKASVIVAAYNSAATIGACLDSLKTLNYRDYETIVIDDGSTDATARIAEAAEVRVVRADHRGLASARNSGIEAASGEIVAFIDADARADSDWLYHLVEAITRRGAAAAGGPNFAPNGSNSNAAFDFAPGIPREVRSTGDELSQLCGCNMAISKSALQDIGGFDTSFTSAGDDVDLSWRLADRVAEKKPPLIHAPGAVVIHERRTSIAAYLRQQRGYGRGEGLLYKKYPLRIPERSGIYGGAGSWLSGLLGGPRVYHGAFGRGLFQTMYASAEMPWLAELPQSFEWIAVSATLAIVGSVNSVLGAIGWLGIIICIATAILGAAFSNFEGQRVSVSTRATLAVLCLIGPVVRSFERERVKLSLAPEAYGIAPIPFSLRGRIVFSSSDDGVAKLDSTTLLESIREALLKYGLAVAVTDGFRAWDLNVVLLPAIRVPLNALRMNDGTIALAWKTTVEPRRTLIAALLIFVVSIAAGMTWIGSILATAAIIAGALAPAILHLRRIPSILNAAAESIAKTQSLKVGVSTGEIP
ncbi:MAG TPA: glycosyltransferase [Candidatus Binataceae bacterium]|nr:glycosyltransferase [Candidatus Binataceae bacterium]